MLARLILFALPLQAAAKLSVLQWNPHWQCYVHNMATCGRNASAQLNSLLSTGVVKDFANIVEINDPTFKQPSNWGRITRQCGQDLTDLFYNMDLWRQGKSELHSCFDEDSRPYIIQVFQSTTEGDSIIVVGAHFSHKFISWMPSSVKDRIALLQDETNINTVVLIADTNFNNGVSNARIMSELGVSGVVTGTTMEETTCCYPNWVDGFAFDRIIATNVLGEVSTQVLLDPFPEWAKSAQLHRPVLATFHGFGEKLEVSVNVTPVVSPDPALEGVATTTVAATAAGASTEKETDDDYYKICECAFDKGNVKRAYSVYKEWCCVHPEWKECNGTLPIGCAAGGLPQICRYCFPPSSKFDDGSLPPCPTGISKVVDKVFAIVDTSGKRKSKYHLRASSSVQLATEREEGDGQAMLQLPQVAEVSQQQEEEQQQHLEL